MASIPIATRRRPIAPRRSRQAGLPGRYADRLLRPGARAKRHRCVRGGDVPAAAALSRFYRRHRRRDCRRADRLCRRTEKAASRRRDCSRASSSPANCRFEEVQRWYRRLTIYAFTSRNEGFGLTLIEAMSVGAALVASRAGAAELVVEDGVTGVLTPPGDADALVAALEPLMRDPASSAAMGRRGPRAGAGKIQPRCGSGPDCGSLSCSGLTHQSEPVPVIWSRPRSVRARRSRPRPRRECRACSGARSWCNRTVAGLAGHHRFGLHGRGKAVQRRP